MREDTSWIRFIAIALLVVLPDHSSRTASAAPPTESPLRTVGDRLLVHFDPGAGAFRLDLLDTDDRTLSQTEIPGLFLDGVHQKNFEIVGRGMRNDSLELQIEELDSGAISLRWSPLDGELHEFLFRLESDDETRYYGTGERFNTLNQRGSILPMSVDDRYGNKGVGSHKPVPFFMSSRGFGVWVDSFSPGTFDLSGSGRFRTDLVFSDWSFRVVLIPGPTLAEILETFTALTGRSPVPPPWAFALWKSRDVHHNREEVFEDVEKLRRFGIPASVLVIDSPWETGYNDFEINRKQFSDPEEMFDRIDQLGFALCLWLTPFINERNVIDMEGIAETSRNFDEAAARGILVEDESGDVALSNWWKGRGGLIDFTDPAALQWWREQLRKTKRWGARAFKADDGEGNFVPDALFHDGTPALHMKNRYSILYNEAMQSYIDEELGGDGALIVRSGYTGVQRYPIAWAGDNRGDFSFEDGLPSVILAGQNAALSGISLWGSDIAGYAGTPDKETFVRWTQFGTFTPFMQVHMTSNLGPWDFDDETLEIFRRYAVLRVQLFPYLYEAVHETSRTGMPVIRPMALAFERDREAPRHIYQYMFGPDLLVAPMYQPGSSRSIYLPEGTWFDFWTGIAHAGPKTIEVSAPLDTLPLFVREGAILPMLPDDVQTLVSRHSGMDEDVVAIDDRRILQVWPGTSGRVSTWDGVEARIDDDVLIVTSETARPIEIELLQRRLPMTAIAGGTMRYDEERGATRIDFPSFEGTATIPLKPRVRQRINESWRYAPGPIEGAESLSFDDAGWSSIDLPHTWNREDAFDDEPSYRRGIGWYRKRLALDPSVEGKRLFLLFEGANQVADVFVNGRHAGGHVGGYTAFVVEITDLVGWDRENVVAVKVDNSHDPNIPPLNADFTFYGGIYRDVWLLATDPVHVSVTDHASPGVFIDTPVVSETSAIVRVSGTVVNQSDGPVEIRIMNRLFDPDGIEVTSTSSSISLAPGTSELFEHSTPEIESPRLWSPDEPSLYRVRTELLDGDRLVDVIDNSFGFRWFSIDPELGFFLNGHPLKLVGTNRHQDHEGFGNALPDELHRTDVRLIEENGFNFLRLAHYPQDPAVLEETDRLGLIVWEEIPVVNLVGISPEFADNSERMLVEMIRQHYNHPSILFWGTQNEVLLTKPNPIPDGYYETLVELIRRLDLRARSEDARRATAMALSRDEIADDRGLAAIPDILGLNLYFGWYYEQLDSLGPFLDALHRERPEIALIISEYGAGSDERVHALEPVAFDFSSEHAQRFHRVAFPQIESRRFVLGSAVWNQFDFGSEFRNDSKPTINQKGLWYYDRTPKDTKWYYDAVLLDHPVLYVAREWNRRAGSGPEDALQPLWVYTNLDEVELFVNERSVGTRRVENRMAAWEVELGGGLHTIRARGIADGRVIEDEAAIRYTDRAPMFMSEEPGIVVAVNAGAAYSYVDGDGLVWEEDRPYAGGSWGCVGGERQNTHRRIASTSDDPLFQTSREGAHRFRFDVSDGTYELELAFCERTDANEGERVFDVAVNGETVIARLDLVAVAGVRAPVVRTIETHARGGNGIVVELVPREGQPAVAGIQVRRLR